MPICRRALSLATCLALSFILLPRVPVRADEAAFFREQVAPILEARCLSCHHGAAARGGLSLETAATLAEGGVSGPPVTPGSPDESWLLDMIEGPEPEMPQEDDPLSAEQIATIRTWIERGAAWPDDMTLVDRKPRDTSWWSLRPLARPEVPAFESDWIRTPIDAFIWAGYEEHDLHRAPEADRRTLIRRVTFDLHGLPPTPEEVEAFVADPDPLAYERLIDRLLDSPRYGERWARHWLDVVHFGETHGYDKDKRRDHAWPYRDYVIRSLNADKPYGQFIREQVAGDVLLQGDAEGIIATGFVTAGPWDFVGHVELREDSIEKYKTRVIDRDDMVANTISTVLSLTAHCARCHDHPFDPITQQEYYGLQAVFAGVERGDREYHDPQIAKQRAEFERQRAELQQQRDRLVEQRAALVAPACEDLDARIVELVRRWEALPNPPGRDEEEITSPTNGYHSAISTERDVQKWVQVDLGRSLPIRGIRLIPARPTDFPDSPGFGFPLRFQVALSDDASFESPIVVADHTADDFPNPGNIPYAIHPGEITARYVRVTAERLWERTDDYVFALAEVEIDVDGHNAAREAEVTALDTIEAGRWSTAHLVDGYDSRHELPDVAAPGVAEALAEHRAVERELAELYRLRGDTAREVVPTELREEIEATAARLSGVERELAALPKAGLVYAVKPIEPRPIHLLARGDVEQRGEEVAPGALSAVGALPSTFDLSDPADEGQRRAALAHWLTDRRNPLTWRSIVNRVWHYHFGRGLVDTPNDFGRNGSTPTHPQLLDWLAVEFAENGESLKSLHRSILTSAVYRQSARHDAELAAIDRGNRYLWRMNRQRLEAESIRDTLLAISGKLDPTMGGPSFELFEFEDDHSPRYDYVVYDDPTVWRRTIYSFTVRSVPNPWLETLDCPDPSLSTPVRNTTITALQALALMNNPFVVRQAEYLAERLAAEDSDAEGQIDRLYRLALGRPPSEEERAALVEYAQRHGLANACRVVINTNEFIFVD